MRLRLRATTDGYTAIRSGNARGGKYGEVDGIGESKWGGSRVQQTAVGHQYHRRK